MGYRTIENNKLIDKDKYQQIILLYGCTKGSKNKKAKNLLGYLRSI
jgi:hypothetical protein